MAIQVFYRSTDGTEFRDLIRAVRYEREYQERLRSDREGQFARWLLSSSEARHETPTHFQEIP